MTNDERFMVVAVLEIRDGAEDEFLEVFGKIAAESQAEEGVLRYAVHRDVRAPQRFVVVEQYADAAAAVAHAQSPHMTGELGQRLGSLLAAPPVLHRLRPVPLGDPAKGVL